MNFEPDPPMPAQLSPAQTIAKLKLVKYHQTDVIGSLHSLQ